MNPKTEIYTALKAVTGVVDVITKWPKEFTVLPLVYYTVEEHTPSNNFTYDQEASTLVKVTVWNKTSVTDLAKLVSDKMATLGYRRTMERDRDGLEEELIGIDMRFKALK